jgi:hypothetical protein
MWLLWLIAALAALGIVGGIFFGGIFTIVLVPLALIALVGGLTYTVMAGAAQRRAGSDADPASTSRGRATRTSQTGSPSTPSTPHELADARRARQ